MTKFTKARALRDPAALPSELRRVAGALSPEPRDILEHAADELERLLRASSVEGRERAVMDRLRRRGLADELSVPRDEVAAPQLLSQSGKEKDG